MNKHNVSCVECEEVPCGLCGSVVHAAIAQGYDYEYQTTTQQFTFVQCAQCGHIFLSPRPKMAYAHIIYPSNYYTLEGRHSAQSSKIISFFKKKIIENRLSFFKDFFTKPVRVLEIGCGDCSLLLSLKHKFPHIACTGVDLAFTETIRAACTHADIALRQGPIEDITLGDSSYDLVILNQLIEHLWHPAQVIAKISRSIAPGGMLSIETVNVCGYDRKFFSKSFWGGYYFPRHMNLFSFESLGALLKRNNFKIVKRYSLLAPIIWTFSFHALVCHTPGKMRTALGKFFADRNPFCLALFAMVDCIALILRCTTSNQKIIARKVLEE
ncbi:MAG: class I SAM-dependent methyltransferase [Candidatus Omnitrophica bacterium]|nr:class I SAM-dependent methyltransferase [Candidatus Omnitrophota bacterium]